MIRFCWLPVSDYFYESVGTKQAGSLNEKVNFLSTYTIPAEIISQQHSEVSSEKGSQLFLKLSKRKNSFSKERRKNGFPMIFGGDLGLTKEEKHGMAWLRDIP